MKDIVEFLVFVTSIPSMATQIGAKVLALEGVGTFFAQHSFEYTQFKSESFHLSPTRDPSKFKSTYERALHLLLKHSEKCELIVFCTKAELFSKNDYFTSWEKKVSFKIELINKKGKEVYQLPERIASLKNCFYLYTIDSEGIKMKRVK